MNKHLSEQIFSIIQRMDDAESKSFEKFTQRKRPTKDGKHAYYQLYEFYRKQKNDPELDENIISKGAERFTENYNDLSKKLKRELLNFLGFNYRENGTDLLEKEISDHIDVGIALYNKRLYLLSMDSFNMALELIQKITDQQFNEKILYLIIKAYSWVFQLRFCINKEKLKDHSKFEEMEDFLEYARSFAQIAHSVKDAFDFNKSKNLFEDQFSQSSFFGLLKIYLREKREFETLNLKESNYFPFIDPLNSLTNRLNSDDAKGISNEIILAGDYLNRLERLYRAVLANEPFEFDNAFNSLYQGLFANRSKKDFNAGLILFLYIQLFELKTIYSLQNGKPLELNGIIDFSKVTHEKIGLFYETQVKNLALRIELNNAIILFLQNNYKQMIHDFEIYETTLKNSKSEYYLDLYVLDIICRLETTGPFDHELDAKIKYYENYIKKHDCVEFHKKYNGFIKALFYAVPNERKDVFKKHISKLEQSAESYNPFHVLVCQWVQNRII